MSDAQKIPFVVSFNAATNKRVLEAFQLTGKALPAIVASVNGAIVTVAFQINNGRTLPNVTCPLFGPEYIRYPIQVGDKGCVFPADAYLGGMSGLGGGLADGSAPANLSALVFFPIGNKTWSTVDPDSMTIYGPNGVVLYDTGKASVFTLTPEGITVITAGTISISTGAATLTMDQAGIYTLIGTVGSKISDTAFHTSPSIMAAAWSAMVTYLNAHTHPAPGGTTGAPSSPFSGGNIAPPGA